MKLISSEMLSLGDLYFYTQRGEGENAVYTYRFQWSNQALIDQIREPNIQDHIDDDETDFNGESYIENDYYIELAKYNYIKANNNDGSSAATSYTIRIFDKETGSLIAEKTTSDMYADIELDEGEYLWEVTAKAGNRVIKASERSYICTHQSNGQESYFNDFIVDNEDCSKNFVIAETGEYYDYLSGYTRLAVGGAIEGTDGSFSRFLVCGPAQIGNQEAYDAAVNGGFTYSASNAFGGFSGEFAATANLLLTNSGIYVYKEGNWFYQAYLQPWAETSEALTGKDYFHIDSDDSPNNNIIFRYDPASGKIVEHLIAPSQIYDLSDNYYITKSGVFSLSSGKLVLSYPIYFGENNIYNDCFMNTFCRDSNGTTCDTLDEGDSGSLLVRYYALSGDTAGAMQEYTIFSGNNIPFEVESDDIGIQRYGNCFCYNLQNYYTGTTYITIHVVENGKVVNSIQKTFDYSTYVEVDDGKLIVSNGAEEFVLYENPDLSGTPWEPFIVENGKVIHNTNLSHKELTVRNGGVASNTVVGYDGELEVQQGGKVVNTTINGGKMTVSSGGTAERVLYNGFADIVISSGGYASVVFNPWQHPVFAENGAVVTTLYENKVFYGNEGQGAILADNRFENLHVESGNSAVVLSGGIIDGVTLDDFANLHVSSGGVITGNWNFSDMAYIYMEQGAELNLDLRKQTVEAKPLFNNLPYCTTITITINPDQAPGEYNICSSGIMTDITLKDTNRTYDTISPWYGSGTVYRGNRFTLDYDYENNIQKLVVKENTTENRTFVSSGGKVIAAGGVLRNNGLANGAVMNVHSGGLVENASVYSRGSIILADGAVADRTGVYGNGALHVYSGAVASNTTVFRSGYLGVGKGATTYDTTIEYAGELTVWGGGKVIGNTINTWGAIILSSGAMADSSVINSNGGLHVYSGAVASNTTVNRNGFFGVGLGAQTYDTTIGYAGELTVWSGGVVHRNEINTWGAIILLDGAVANSTTVNANGGLHIYKGATAYTTTVTSGANLGIGLGGYLHGARLENNATMTFYDGSYLGGWNDFAGTVKMQGKVNAAGSYISLELQNRTADQGYLISNIGYFQNVGRFSIEVSGKQTGNYILAYGATNFKDAVTLYIDDVDRGKIAVGQKLNYDGINYSLLKHGDTLSLNISNDSRLSCESITSGTANGLLA